VTETEIEGKRHILEEYKGIGVGHTECV